MRLSSEKVPGWLAAVIRLRAELLLTQGDDAEAEAGLHKTIEVGQKLQVTLNMDDRHLFDDKTEQRI